MAAQTSRRPYLFKDPRFCYTLTCWRPYLADDTIFICVFREPHHTINSITKVLREERYLRDLRMTPEMIYEYWESIYKSVLHQRTLVDGTWLFVHYDELLTKRAIPLLEDHLEASANLAMLQPDFNRSVTDIRFREPSDDLRRGLLKLAEEKYSKTELTH
jgi:hypothetical protein